MTVAEEGTGDNDYDFGSIKKKKKKWKKPKKGLKLKSSRNKSKDAAPEPHHIFFNSMNHRSGMMESIRAGFGRWLILLVPMILVVLVPFLIFFIYQGSLNGMAATGLAILIVTPLGLITGITAYMILDKIKRDHLIKNRKDSFNIELGPEKMQVRSVVRYLHLRTNIEVNVHHEFLVKDIRWVHRFSDQEYLMEHPIGYFLYNRGVFKGALNHPSANRSNLYMVDLAKPYKISHHRSETRFSPRPMFIRDREKFGPNKEGFEEEYCDRIILDIPDMNEFKKVVKSYNPKVKFFV